jgi:uncharacterized protein YhfF
MMIELFWKAFLVEKGLDKNTKYLESFHFDLNEKSANELLELVLIGQKRATASSLWNYEIQGTHPPKVGDYSIVTDWDGNPRCVIMTTNIRILAFKDMTFDICKLEGEDDSLESWRKNHIKFFTDDGEDTGYTFSEEMPVLFEEFEVVYQC